MSETEQGQTPQNNTAEKSAPKDVLVADPKTKKIWSRDDIKRSIKFKLHMPDLYPDFQPWGFNLRLKLSGDAEERRQEYLGLSASEQTVKEGEQNLDEICDLLVKLPTGFGDLQDLGTAPGVSFKSYYDSSDESTKEFILNIVRGAVGCYWRKISPYEFRTKV